MGYGETLRIRWEAGLNARRAEGEFGSMPALLAAQPARFLAMIARMNEQIEAGALHELYDVFAGYFADALQDFAHAARLGLISDNQSRFLQEAVLNTLDIPDYHYGGTLGARVRQDLGGYLRESPKPRPCFEDGLRTPLATIVSTLNTMDHAVYRLLTEKL